MDSWWTGKAMTVIEAREAIRRDAQDGKRPSVSTLNRVAHIGHFRKAAVSGWWALTDSPEAWAEDMEADDWYLVIVNGSQLVVLDKEHQLIS